MSLLLSPIKVAKLSLENRVVMSPMCMFTVEKKDGIITPFHFAHYSARAIAKVGLIIIEATAVNPDGRITDQDLGLWNDAQAQELKKLVTNLHNLGTKVGIQIAHAGRKAEDALYPVAPSAISFSETYKTPNEMSLADIQNIQSDFVTAVQRAISSGIDMIELHGAHGYLINQFLAPATNKRIDEYGGSLENRYRFAKEIIKQVRKFYQGSLWIRLSLTDYLATNEQNSMEDWKKITKWLEADGIDCIDVSTGGVVDTKPNIPIHAGYQTTYATKIKNNLTIPVTTVGLLDNPGLCEYILQNNQADLVLIGRALIRNTNWLVDAAKELRDKNFMPYNDAYKRGQN